VRLDEALGDRLFVKACKSKRLLHMAGKALVEAHSLLGFLLGYRLIDLRAEDDPLRVAQATIEELAARLGAFEELVALLGERWDKIADRRRPHYTPEQRYRIVRLRRVLHLSVRDIARVIRVSTDTVYEWDREARREPGRETVGSLVKPTPPVRRYDDAVHHVVQTMGMLGFGGHQKIAEYLGRAAIKVSKRTVGRYRRQARVPPPEPSAAPTTERATPTTVTARLVHHVWMMDLTTVPRLFGFRRVLVAAILDVFSRMPLAAQTFTSEPSAAEVASLLDRAAQRFGRPRHLVTDQGPQFTSELFQELVACLGIKQRFGAVGQKGSIAIIERFWRTIKHAARLRPLPPLTREDLERRLEIALAHYAHFRPHSGLGGATPAMMLFGDPSPTAVPPPRGRPGDPSAPLPVEITALDRQGHFPVLLKAA
jgi:transposase InsO family protein